MKSENIIFNEEVQEDVLDDIKFAKTMASDILFNMYYLGEGTKKDLAKAFIMAKNSAELGIEKAQYNLAQMYEKGIGTYKDYERAVYWYEKAIDNNYVEGELYYRLGNLYDKGLGVKENKRKGKRLMRKALDLGYTPIN
jgi:TPR repeat protein